MKYLVADSDLFRFQGRIIFREDAAYLGYTNSSVTLRVRGAGASVSVFTGINEEVNDPSVRLYIDGEYLTDYILSRDGIERYHKEHERDTDVDLSEVGCSISPAGEGGSYRISVSGLSEDSPHDIRIVKQTEAAMSYVAVAEVETDGELLPITEPDERVKVEFIGDSITCGYGIHSPLPEDNYTLWDEDGEDSYAGILAREMNWNARWISASGYGLYISYDSSTQDAVPRLYPYVNWFVDKKLRIDPSEFEPEFIFINLGTNDSGHIEEPGVLDKFREKYTEFIVSLKKIHPQAKIICLMGTLCDFMYKYVLEVVDEVKAMGYDDIYSLETPFHDVETDGVADGHPTYATHKKDAKRVLDFMKEKVLV